MWWNKSVPTIILLIKRIAVTFTHLCQVFLQNYGQLKWAVLHSSEEELMPTKIYNHVNISRAWDRARHEAEFKNYAL
jgi:hypothetical protein